MADNNTSINFLSIPIPWAISNMCIIWFQYPFYWTMKTSNNFLLGNTTILGCSFDFCRCCCCVFFLSMHYHCVCVTFSLFWLIICILFHYWHSIVSDDVVSEFIFAASNRSPFNAIERRSLHIEHSQLSNIGFRKLQVRVPFQFQTIHISFVVKSY